MLAGGIRSVSASPLGSVSGPLPLEAGVTRLQALMRSGELSSRELTQGYLTRIARLNPLLGAVIETNPQALAIAAQT